LLDSSGIWVNRSSKCFATEPTSERRGGHKPPRPLSGYTPTLRSYRRQTVEDAEGAVKLDMRPKPRSGERSYAA